MRYIRVSWIHDDPESPVQLYSELDDNSWELRKVEIFVDGIRGFADATETSGSTLLGLEPVPPLAEIALDRQFHSEEIDQKEFERIWDLAHSVIVARQS